jgi:hypothetical protein
MELTTAIKEVRECRAKRPGLLRRKSGQTTLQPQSFVMPTPMTPQGMPDFRQRDAFIASINNSLGQQMSFGTPTPQPPQLNFPTLWQQAGQMVNNGWQNPLAGLFM